MSSFATLSPVIRELVALLYCLNDDAVKTSNTDISVKDYKKLGFLQCVDVLNLRPKGYIGILLKACKHVLIFEVDCIIYRISCLCTCVCICNLN